MSSCVGTKELVDLRDITVGKVYVIDTYPNQMCFKIMDKNNMMLYKYDKEINKLSSYPLNLSMFDIMLIAEGIEEGEKVTYTFFYNTNNSWFLNSEGDVFRYTKFTKFGEEVIYSTQKPRRVL